MKLPERQAADHRVPRFLQRASAHTMPFIQNLGKLGIRPTTASSTPRNTRPEPTLSTSTWSPAANGGSSTPGVELKVAFTPRPRRGRARATSPASPIRSVDALIETIADAKSREELNTACRALDRVLRAGHYWVPMWYRDTAWVAYWDAFSRPERQPKLATGAPGTWWWDGRRPRRSDCERRQFRRPRSRPAAAVRLTHARLYPPPPPADDPDDLRHHGGLVRHRAIRSRRPGRARIAKLRAPTSSTAGSSAAGAGRSARRGSPAGGDIASRYRGSQGLDPKFIKELEKQYGFDKPALERFWILVRDYATFNFGKSYYRDSRC